MSCKFKNIYLREDGGKKYFCYRSGLTVYEEVFSEGRLMAAGWNTAGYTLNVLEDFPSNLKDEAFFEPQAFDLEADGVSLSFDWEYVGFEESEETLENGTEITHAVITLKSTVKSVTAKIHTVLDGTAYLTRWIEAANDGQAPMNINLAVPMCGGIEIFKNYKDYMDGTPDPSKIYSLGYMDSAVWAHEGYFKWHDLPPISYSFGAKHTDGDFRNPFFMLRNNLLGTLMVGQLAWSGGYKFEFTLDADDPDNSQAAVYPKLSYKIMLDSPKPHIILGGGESFTMPSVHIAMMRDDFDGAINELHRHQRRSVFTMPPSRGVYGWIEGGMGPERTMDERAMRHFIDTISAVGGETFIIDAGWYCPAGTESKEWGKRAGDWHADTEKHPDKLKAIRDYAHEKGLLFGMWLDLERLGEESEMAKAHPEWISKRFARGAEKPTTQLNMAIPEASAWAEAELSRVIEEYGLDLFRLDYNVCVDRIRCRYEGEHGTESNFVRYYQNAYAMYERLKKKFPNVVFENCAGGGMRTDIAFVRNFDHTWVSDHNEAPRSVAVTNGMTMVLPPERVDRLCSGMNCHKWGSIEFQVRNTIFGRPTTNDYNCVGSEFNPQQLETVKRTFDIYKKHIRPYIPESKIFHHTPELVNVKGTAWGVADRPHGTAIIERASGDGAHGVIGIFNLADAKENVHTVFPRGMDTARNYRVTFDNSGAVLRLSGAEMLQFGIRVSLSGSISSELVIYEAE